MAHLCPPKELSICWAYEFTREYVRQGNPVPISAFWRLPKPLVKKGKDTEWLIATSYLLAVSIKPSLLRRKKTPKGLIEALARYSTMNPIRLWLGDEPPGEVMHIAVDWSKSDHALKKSFGKLLEKIRPSKPSEARGVPLHKKRIADLKALGAFRLVEVGFSQNMAIDFTEKERRNDLGKIRPLFSRQTDMARAISRAKVLLSEWPQVVAGG
jgi:hypothetical protein